jgi:hypothetical protein
MGVRRIARHSSRQPALHVHRRVGAFEYDVAVHAER